MKRIALLAISTLAALVALFSYPTSTGNSGTTAALPVSAAKVLTQPGTSSASTTGQGPDPATTSTSGAGPAPSTSAQPSTGSVTVDGASEMTRYGVVQVQVVITGGAITDVIPVQYPQQSGMDQQINSQAIPMLRSQVLSAQSAKIDGVSGATFTSEGYITSLQSALDAAGFGK